MEGPHLKISSSKTSSLLEYLLNNNYRVELQNKKDKILIYKDNEFLFGLRPPLSYPSLKEIDEIKQWDYKNIHKTYIVFLVRSGIASLGLIEDGELIKHKVLRSYMNRKKQGKSQLSYLKTKGKSRAGSRVRLENAKIFFEEISTLLNKWAGKKNIPFYYFIPIPLLSYWNQTSTPPPSQIKLTDSKKIPLNVKTPSFGELQRIINLIEKGELLFNNKELFEEWGKIIEKLKE